MPIELGTDERRAITQKARLAVLDAVRALGGEATRGDILARALTDSRFTAEELAAETAETADSAGRKPQGLVQSRLHWELSTLKREGLLENPERGVWRLTEAGAKKPEPLIRVRVSLDRLAELRAMSEQEYLDSPEWQRTREVALELAGHRCSRDRRHKDDLDVHHVIRVRIGAELPADLVVLCSSCYAQERPRVNELPPLILDAGEPVEAVSIAPPSAIAPAVAHSQTDEPGNAGEPSDMSEPTDAERSLLKRIFSRAA